MPNFNDRLKELRIDSNLNQSELAKEMSLTQSVISKYEKGLISPDVDILKKLAKYFDVSVDYLLGITDVSNFNKKYFKNKEVKNLIKNETIVFVYLEPYKYKDKSEGFFINDEIDFEEREEEDRFNDLLYDNINCNYDSEDFKDCDCFDRAWFKIKGQSLSGKVYSMGYITGYYIPIDHIILEYDDMDNAEVFSQFEFASDLMMEFFFRVKDIANNYIGDFYFINTFLIDKKYYSEELEEQIIEELKEALYRLHGYEVNTLFYSGGYTTLEDDTKIYTDAKTIKRHLNNMEKIGFKELSAEDEEIIPLYVLSLTEDMHNLEDEEDYIDENDDDFFEYIKYMDQIVDLVEKYNISDEILDNITEGTVNKMGVSPELHTKEVVNKLKDYIEKNNLEKIKGKLIDLDAFKNNKKD